MDDLLFLVHRIPFPPDKGDKIRSYHLLSDLARHYKVILAAFIDDPADAAHASTVRAMCDEAFFAELNPRTARLRSLGALAARRPMSIDYYRDRRMHAWVRALASRRRIDRIVVFSSTMAQYARAFPHARCVIDFCDVDSLKWRQYGTLRGWPLSWLYQREAALLLKYERRFAYEAAAALFASPAEASRFNALAPESVDRVSYFRNGVNAEYFSPYRDYRCPYPQGVLPIVFCGAMDYWPNADAASWFALEVLPGVRARHPGAVFYVIGARPAPAVARLAELDGVMVTGRVDDVRPYVAHAALSVAPLRVARGIQNKVLEAMALGVPVLASPAALEGLGAVTGIEVLVAEGPAQFVAKASAVLARQEQDVGQRARRAIEARYAWEPQLARVRRIIEGGVADAAS